MTKSPLFECKRSRNEAFQRETNCPSQNSGKKCSSLPRKYKQMTFSLNNPQETRNAFKQGMNPQEFKTRLATMKSWIQAKIKYGLTGMANGSDQLYTVALNGLLKK